MLLKIASQRLFLDAANHVVVTIRENQKSTWIDLFRMAENLSSSEVALEKLKSHPKFSKRATDVADSVCANEVEGLYWKFLNEMTGGSIDLCLGRGKWLDMIQGKAVLAQLINSPAFEVKPNTGKALQGREKLNRIVKDLLQQGSTIQQPQDFQDLKSLVLRRIQAS